jgi:lipopolysaccharide export system ATP-binding protein
LKILFGTLKPKKSEIYFDNQIIKDTSILNKYIGYHHHDVFLPLDITVRNLVLIFLPDGEKQSKVLYAPRINKIEKQMVGTLSVGEQRYLQFLLMINSNHFFLLLDEPFTMVEPLLKELIKEKIDEYRFDKGFIITDHYYTDVLEVARSKKLLKDGALSSIINDGDLITSGYLSR